MNHVERFRALMDFQPVDRLPRWEWAMWWDLTIERWQAEGLPGDWTFNRVFDIAEWFGLDPYQQFPRLRMIGHFDKMTMTRGEAAMRAEFERLRPLMRSGGFIPSVDHQTPPGVSLAQYRTYLRLLAEYLGATP